MINRARLICTFVILAILSCLTNTVKAQSPLHVGIKGGLAVSSHLKKFIFRDNDIDLTLIPKAALGYQGGFIIRKGLSKSLRILTEPSLILLGANYDEPFMYRGFELRTRSRTELMYIQLPLLLQLTTVPPHYTVYGHPFAATTYHLTGGIYGGYLLDAQFSGTISGAPVGIVLEGDFTNDINSQTSSYNGGIMLGGGIERGRNNKIGFETRVLFSVFESANDPDIVLFKPQNMAITFGFYVLF